MFAPRSAASILTLAVLLAALHALEARASEPAEPGMSYSQARDFLAKHTKVLELTNNDGGKVLVCPQYQGRVMTSTCPGQDGQSFGWINQSFIEQGKKDAHFNNYGGEERFWLGPEGGQFSLWFAPGAKQDLEHWLTPPALNEGAFAVDSSAGDPNVIHLTRRMQFENASKTRFDLEVKRNVRLLGAQQFGKLFGADARKVLDAGELKLVGYETENTIINRGAPMTKEKGLIAIWSLGQFPPGPQTQIIIPFKPGNESNRGPIVKSDYFGAVPPDRLKVGTDVIQFLGDGNFRSKIGISQQRVRNVAGAIDRSHTVLTLVQFSLPEDPAHHPYVNNAWDLPQREPYVGDVFNSYNDGPPAPGKPALGGFFELESLSPAAELATGQSLSHVKSTFHVQGNPAAIESLAKAALGVKGF